MMTMYGWTQRNKVLVPATGSVSVALPAAHPVLEKLTVWATGGARTMEGLTFQPRLNGLNFGASVAHAGPGPMALLVRAFGDQVFLPALSVAGSEARQDAQGDALQLDILVSSTFGSDQTVTLLFAGVGYGG